MRIGADRVVYSMDKCHPPALRVPSGSVVTFETIDAFGGQVTSADLPLANLDWSRVNPATGPLYIEGAYPGDSLRIEILFIEVDSPGIIAAIPGAGLFSALVRRPQVQLLPFVDGAVVLPGNIVAKLQPMIGVIGTAPAGEAVPCGVPGSHGGNMDNARIVTGTTLYLPVFVPGALLSIRDLHALMGDGEVMVTGVECSGTVTVRITVQKRLPLANPQHEDAEHYYTIASHESLDEAVKQSACEMLALVMQRSNLSLSEAGMLLSCLGQTQICQVVDPKMTARFAFPKAVLHKLGSPNP